MGSAWQGASARDRRTAPASAELVPLAGPTMEPMEASVEGARRRNRVDPLRGRLRPDQEKVWPGSESAGPVVASQESALTTERTAWVSGMPTGRVCLEPLRAHTGRLGAGVDWGGVVVAGGRGVVVALTVGVVGIVDPGDGGVVARGVGAEGRCVGDVAASALAGWAGAAVVTASGVSGRAGWGFVGGQQGTAIGADHRVCPGIDRPAASASPPWFPP